MSCGCLECPASVVLPFFTLSKKFFLGVLVGVPRGVKSRRVPEGNPCLCCACNPQSSSPNTNIPNQDADQVKGF